MLSKAIKVLRQRNSNHMQLSCVSSLYASVEESCIILTNYQNCNYQGCSLRSVALLCNWKTCCCRCNEVSQVSIFRFLVFLLGLSDFVDFACVLVFASVPCAGNMAVVGVALGVCAGVTPGF